MSNRIVHNYRFGVLFFVVVHLFIPKWNVAQTFPAGFNASAVGSGWQLPMGVAFNHTGSKLFVWEKAGKVYLFNWNSTTSNYEKQPTPVIDLSAEVGNWGDHGLMGFTLHPNYEVNGLIYLLYVVDRHHLLNYGTPNYNAATDTYFQATIGRVTRYRTIKNTSEEVVADPLSRQVLIGETKTTGIPITYDSHGMGSLAFGTDTTLLISCGDGASYNNYVDSGSNPTSYYQQALADGILRPNENRGAYRAQMVNSFSGKILRIDPMTGDGLPTNPFYQSNNPRAPRSRVWAMGFRNPFRFSVKPRSGSTDPTAGDPGDLYVGDVGNGTIEELDIINAPGQNCGWPVFEGIITTAKPDYYGTIKKLNNYDEPNPLYGSGGCTQPYFTFQQLIKQATADNNTTIYNPCSPTTPITGTPGARYFHRVAALDWNHWVDSARVKVFNGNTLGVAQIGTSASGVTGTPFRGNSSSGGCWYTGDMFPAAYKNTFFLADYGANWIKSLSMDATVTDKLRQVSSFASGFSGIIQIVENPLDGSLFTVDIGSQAIIRIIYGNGNLRPLAKIAVNNTYGLSPLTVNFNSSGSKDPEGGVMTYSWNFGDGSALSTSPNPSHTFTVSNGLPKKFVVYLTVKDNQNATAVDSIIISVNNTPPAVTITSPVKNSFYAIGPDTTYTLSASVRDTEHAPGQLYYQWQVFFRHNNHEHPEPVDTNKTTSAVLSRPPNTSTDTYYWMIKLTVTDAAGLTTQDSSKLFPLVPGTSPPTITLQPQSQTLCSGATVTFRSAVSDTPLPMVYWEQRADGQEWTRISGADQPELTFIVSLADSSKQYRAVWWNGAGTTISTAATLTVGRQPPQPHIVVQHECDGSALLSTSDPGNYLWSTGSRNASVRVTTSGLFTLIITLDNGCTDSASQEVSLITDSLTARAELQQPILCYGSLTGSVSLQASGGLGPYSFGADTITYQESNLFGGLAAGEKQFFIKDARGCVAATSLTITQPDSPLVIRTSQVNIAVYGAETGAITVMASGGVVPYYYQLDSNAYQSNGSYTGLAAGTYQLRVRDANGCVSSTAVVLTEAPDNLNCVTNNWLGTVSTAWEDPLNWDCGTVPTATTEVVINPGTLYYPVITSHVVVRSLTLHNGAYVSVSGNYKLKILQKKL